MTEEIKVIASPFCVLPLVLSPGAGQGARFRPLALQTGQHQLEAVRRTLN